MAPEAESMAKAMRERTEEMRQRNSEPLQESMSYKINDIMQGINDRIEEASGAGASHIVLELTRSEVDITKALDILSALKERGYSVDLDEIFGREELNPRGYSIPFKAILQRGNLYIGW